MRAAIINEQGKPLVIEHVADPTPGPDDAVIKIHASGICRSDWHGWQGDFSWMGFGMQLPAIPGHEFGGNVVALGKNVTRFKEGDWVTAPFHTNCGHCEYCLSGDPNLCSEVSVYGFGGRDGSYAEYLLVPEADANLLHLPENVSPTTDAALGCRFMTGYHAVARGQVEPGDWVAIQGAGGVGMSAIQTAVAVGAQVIAVDISDEKLQQARYLGASAVINSRNEVVAEAVREITGGGAHVGIDALGIQETITHSITSLRKGGRHVQVGLTGSDEQGMATVPTDAVTAAELEIVGSFGNPQPKFPGLLSLVSQERLQPTLLVEREVSLEDVNAVFEKMSNFETKGFNIITTF